MKKEEINYKKERVVLSEVLPYETPAIFSNRAFYNFLIENKLETIDGNIDFDNSKLNPVYKKIFKTTKKNGLRTIPFSFKIAHKNGTYRELSIFHPINQIYLVEFYSKFKDVIKYFCNQSRFSIRRPVNIAKYRYVNDYLHRSSKNSYENHKNFELDKENTEHLKSYFVYKKYNFIYKFFESNQYHNCEKKYQELYKVDISKCFDSIYTHSIAWAIYDKTTVKENLSSSSGTFAGIIDQLMQDMNYGETNGILIGSEISRIVAEILLQQIDKEIHSELNTNLKFKEDYQIFRYVDDYFIFSRNKKIRKKILKVLNHQLKRFKFHINDSKSAKYKKPIITGLSIAKHKISTLLNDELRMREKDKELNEDDQKKWSIYLNSKKLITKFKIIIKEADIDYSNILNYSISTIERKYMQYISELEKVSDKSQYISDFIKFSLELIRFLFFIYSVAPRVSSTIKIVSILSKILNFIDKLPELELVEKNYIFNSINYEIRLILEENKRKKYSENETLYLLIVLNELGDNYLINENKLKEYLNIRKEQNSLNYFSITTILYYIANHSCYSTLKKELKVIIKDKFKRRKLQYINIDTELVLLLLDLIACPYLDIKYKKELLNFFKISSEREQMFIINDQKNWFIKWKDFNLVNEMELKKSQEVYC